MMLCVVDGVISAGQTRVYQDGEIELTANQPRVELPVKAGVVRYFQVLVNSNNLDNATTFQVLVNGAATHTLVLGAGLAPYPAVLLDAASVANGDNNRVTFQVNASASGGGLCRFTLSVYQVPTFP